MDQRILGGTTAGWDRWYHSGPTPQWSHWILMKMPGKLHGGRHKTRKAIGKTKKTNPKGRARNACPFGVLFLLFLIAFLDFLRAAMTFFPAFS